LLYPDGLSKSYLAVIITRYHGFYQDILDNIAFTDTYLLMPGPIHLSRPPSPWMFIQSCRYFRKLFWFPLWWKAKFLDS